MGNALRDMVPVVFVSRILDHFKSIHEKFSLTKFQFQNLVALPHVRTILTLLTEVIQLPSTELGAVK